MPVDARREETYLRVERAAGVARVVATARFLPGARLLRFEGEIVAQPSRYTVQVGAGEHLAPRPGEEERCLWRFLNHACFPNAAVVGRHLVALTAIAPGDEVTFNYNCTEFDLDVPFPCHCGRCGGVPVRGWRHLGAAERERLEPFAAAHLRVLAAASVSRHG